MKRLTTAVMLLLAVLALCVGTQYRLGRLADEMAAEIDHFSLCARENDIQRDRKSVGLLQAQKAIGNPAAHCSAPSCRITNWTKSTDCLRLPYRRRRTGTCQNAACGRRS